MHVTAAAKCKATREHGIGRCQVTEQEVQGGDLPAFVTRWAEYVFQATA